MCNFAYGTTTCRKIILLERQLSFSLFSRDAYTVRTTIQNESLILDNFIRISDDFVYFCWFLIRVFYHYL